MEQLIITEFDKLRKTQQTIVKHQDNQRWGKYEQQGYAGYQNSLQHTIQATRLGIELLSFESILNDRKFDKFLVTTALLLHDEGEIKHKDVLYGEKNKSDDEREIEFFRNEMLPTYENKVVDKVKEEMIKAFMLQFKSDSFESILFQGIERLGYVSDAYNFYKQKNNDRIMVETLRYQHHHLKRLSKDIVSLEKIYYTPKIREKLESYMNNFKDKTWPKL